MAGPFSFEIFSGRAGPDRFDPLFFQAGPLFFVLEVIFRPVELFFGYVLYLGTFKIKLSNQAPSFSEKKTRF